MKKRRYVKNYCFSQSTFVTYNSRVTRDGDVDGDGDSRRRRDGQWTSGSPESSQRVPALSSPVLEGYRYCKYGVGLAVGL